jgi:hypothetical protein
MDALGDHGFTIFQSPPMMTGRAIVKLKLYGGDLNPHSLDHIPNQSLFDI